MILTIWDLHCHLVLCPWAEVELLNISELCEWHFVELVDGIWKLWCSRHWNVAQVLVCNIEWIPLIMGFTARCVWRSDITQGCSGVTNCTRYEACSNSLVGTYKYSTHWIHFQWCGVTCNHLKTLQVQYAYWPCQVIGSWGNGQGDVMHVLNFRTPSV